MARYGDAWNIPVIGPDGLASLVRTIGVLRRHCTDAGRDEGEIEKTVMLGLDVTAAARQPERVLSRCDELAAAGVSHVILSAGTTSDPHDYAVCAKEIVPGLGER